MVIGCNDGSVVMYQAYLVDLGSSRVEVVYEIKPGNGMVVQLSDHRNPPRKGVYRIIKSLPNPYQLGGYDYPLQVPKTVGV